MARRLALLDPRRGYDLVAPHFQSWYWSRFWRANEAPLVRRWLRELPSGLGLDAGAGCRPYAEAIAQAGHRAISADMSRSMLLQSRRRAPSRREDRVQADVRALPFGTGTFDWVLCTRVLSHLADFVPVFVELARVLRAGGEMLVTDVHPGHPYEHVSVRTPGGLFNIETHKHRVDQVRAAAASVGMQVVHLEEYRTRNLVWQPSQREFRKLYRRPDAPVFYSLALRGGASGKPSSSAASASLVLRASDAISAALREERS